MGLGSSQESPKLFTLRVSCRGRRATLRPTKGRASLVFAFIKIQNEVTEETLFSSH